MELNIIKKKEITDFLKIFEITPTFCDNKIESFTKKESKGKRFFRKICYSKIHSRNNTNEMETFTLYDQSETIKINKENNNDIKIEFERERKKYNDNYYVYPDNANKHDESRLTILGNHDKTIDFITFNKGEILFIIQIGSTISLYNYKHFSENKLLLPVGFKERLKDQFNYSEEEIKITLNYIFMRIYNIYMDMIINPNKYEERLNRAINDIMIEYERWKKEFNHLQIEAEKNNTPAVQKELKREFPKYNPNK